MTARAVTRHRDGLPARPVRIALVDDNPFIADVLKRTFARIPERFRFLGSAARMSELPGLLGQEAADVVLIDFSMPDGSGADAFRHVRRAWPRATLILFSGSSEPTMLRAAVAAGADGVLAKARGISDLPAMIEQAHRGELLPDPEWLRDLMPQPTAGNLQPDRAPALTHGERRVLEAVLTTGSTELAARQLGIARARICAHLHRAGTKLGAGGRLQTLGVALLAGLIRAPGR
jgi:DNA-binding NarL/FixJ family response regulator